jgi:MSHA biogenesis protein MshP
MSGHATRGFALITAIVIVVILAALGAFIVSVTGLRDQSQALDILGTRALHAARSGIEVAMFNIHAPETGAGGNAYTCANANMTFGGVLAPFTVTVTCSSTQRTEDGLTIRVYEIVANACNAPLAGACPNGASTNASYVERQVTALTETCRLTTALTSPRCS